MSYKRVSKKSRWGTIIADCKGCDNKGKCPIKQEKGVSGICVCEIKRRLFELENKMENGTLVEKPKYKLKQKVYLIMNGNAIKGTIDGYDFFMQKYLVFIDIEKGYGGLGFGNEWFLEKELFPTKAEAEKKLKELQNDL